MKKTLLLIICSLFYANVYAYSERIIPGGESIGINIETKGILITGFYRIDDNELNSSTPKLMIGDRITHVNGFEVNTIDELTIKMKENVKNDEVILTIDRDNKKINTRLKLVYKNGTYKTGLYVKDEINGIGTLSYIDPNSMVYGALGHDIRESETNKKIEISSGTIFKSKITSIDRSIKGSPGGKNAQFYKNEIYGNISKNETTGIYGKYNKINNTKKTLLVGDIKNIKTGKAFIRTVIEGEDVKNFEIKITNIDTSSPNKNINFVVTDKKLLEKSGGIVQGMSGSPIIQDDKIIGVVSHVVVSNPIKGYGIDIVKMLEEGDKLST